MGIKLGTDIIATPNQGGGVISLPPSLLMLGGRQYRTSLLSRTISADVTLAANTLYFVYAQLVAGVPALRISATIPSLYKLANPTATLVTAFYSSGKAVPDFGCFMTIEGIPTSIGLVDSGPMVSNVHMIANINPTFTTTNYNAMRWWRKGRHLNHDWELSMIATGGAGSGAYRLLLPFVPNPAEHTPLGFNGTETGVTPAMQRTMLPGLGHLTNAAQRGHVTGFLWDTNSVGMIAEAVYGGYGVWSNSNYGLTSAQHFRYNMRDVSITGWNDTPLKDL